MYFKKIVGVLSGDYFLTINPRNEKSSSQAGVARALAQYL